MNPPDEIYLNEGYCTRDWARIFGSSSGAENGRLEYGKHSPEVRKKMSRLRLWLGTSASGGLQGVQAPSDTIFHS
jgi:hypothetical protein